VGSGIYLAGSLQRGGTTFVIAMICAISGLVLVFFTVHKKVWSPITAPVYAILEGIIMGVASAIYDIHYPGIAIQAVCLTVVMCCCLLAAYRLGIIQITKSYNQKILAALSGVALYYIISLILMLFGVRAIPMITGGTIGVVFSVIIVIIAGLGLVSNVDAAVQCSKQKLPRYMEWYLALGLIVALIWLYFEILDLMSKVRKTEQQ
jgi:uncharacterized YccA/Bax inhibitor family protein